MSDIEQPPNSALSVKLDYMQRDIGEIKSDVKSIKSDYISRREHDQDIKELSDKTTTHFGVVEDRVNKIYSIVYWFMGLLGTATFASVVAPAIARLFK